MPMLHVNIIPSHPKHPERPGTVIVGTVHNTPVVSNTSLRTDPFIVVKTVTKRLPNGKGRWAAHVTVPWGGKDLSRAREMARKHGGTVMRRNGSTYQHA